MLSLSLSILIFSPLVISLLFLLPFFWGHEVIIRRIAKTFALAHFVYSLLFLVFSENLSQITYYEELKPFGTDWISFLGMKFSFGVDGLSMLMIILTSFIILIACLSSKIVIKSKHHLYYALIFMLQTAVLGVFCSRDIFLFFMFWEFELIPMYFLIGQWGDVTAKKSAMKFLLYTFLGSLFLFLGLLVLYNFSVMANSQLTGDMFNFKLTEDSIPLNMQIFISICLLIGFLVKMPIVPLHTWLPDAHTDAPAPISVILASLLLKLGAYGIIRFNLQILPDAFVIIAPYLFVMAVISIIYTAVLAYYQTDIKKIIAYSSIASMGIVLLGLTSLTRVGFIGAVYQMISHALITAGLFIIAGTIYLRCKTRDIIQLGGLATVMPRLFAFATFMSLASVGMPFTSAFVAEFLTFFGAITSPLSDVIFANVLAIIALLILILSVAYILKFLHKVFYGAVLERWKGLRDLANHEFLVLLTLSIAILVFGVLPMSLINIIEPVFENILVAFGG